MNTTVPAISRNGTRPSKPFPNAYPCSFPETTTLISRFGNKDSVLLTNPNLNATNYERKSPTACVVEEVESGVASLPRDILDIISEFFCPSEDQDIRDFDEPIQSKLPSDSSSEDHPDTEKDGESSDLKSASRSSLSTEAAPNSKRRYSRLSDGYERLKNLVPSLRDKRRASKARILDESCHYVRKLEAMLAMLRNEHERLLRFVGQCQSEYNDAGCRYPYPPMQHGVVPMTESYSSSYSNHVSSSNRYPSLQPTVAERQIPNTYRMNQAGLSFMRSPQSHVDVGCGGTSGAANVFRPPLAATNTNPNYPMFHDQGWTQSSVHGKNMVYSASSMNNPSPSTPQYTAPYQTPVVAAASAADIGMTPARNRDGFGWGESPVAVFQHCQYNEVGYSGTSGQQYADNPSTNSSADLWLCGME